MLLRDFRSLRRDFLAGRTSSREKHLENFSKFVSKVFGGLPWWLACDLDQSRKMHVLRFKVSLPSNILWLFIVFPVWTSLKLTVSLSKIPIITHHFYFNLQEKVWVFLFFISISCSLPWTSWFVSYYCDLKFIDEYGWFWVFAVLLKLLCGLCWIHVISLCLWLH